MGTLFTNEIGDCFGIDEEFVCRDLPAGNTRNEPLAENTRKRGGEMQADMILLTRLKVVNDAIDVLLVVVLVKRVENKVTRLGSRHRRRHRLRTAHLPHEKDVYVFTKRREQRRGEIFRINAHLTLIDE